MIPMWTALDVSVLDTLQLFLFGPYLENNMLRCDGPAKYGVRQGPDNLRCLNTVLATNPLLLSFGCGRGWGAKPFECGSV